MARIAGLAKARAGMGVVLTKADGRVIVLQDTVQEIGRFRLLVLRLRGFVRRLLRR